MDSLHTYSSELNKQYGIKNIPIIENIWGHRFRTDQTPSILLFELMCVIESQLQAKNVGLINSIFNPENDKLYFKHRQFFKLRILIYQNEILETLINSKLTDEEKWERQFDHLKALEGDLFQFKDDDIEHIRNNFSTFESFYNAVNILSSLTFDPLSKKRWTSKFIYPISSEYIWCDFDNKRQSEDRRFFCRGGEIVYLMLCRADHRVREELEEKFESWLSPQNNSFAKLANLLVRPEVRKDLKLREEVRKDLGYLPYHQLPIFSEFAQDLSNILSLELERLDKVKVMIDIIGYHIGNYILSIGESYHNTSNPTELKRPNYLVEILSKVTNSIRKTSIQSISTQRNKLKRSLATRVGDIVSLYEDVIEAETELEDNSDKERKISKQIENAESYLATHISNYPNVCFREIGFLSKKNTRSYRYVLTEDFLHSLVLTILGNEKRMEYSNFKNDLKERYSIFVDVTPDNYQEVIQRDLNRNSKNLASLLYQMGMLRHLSDACSYVINPYKEDSV
ncbi:hypothetical protein CWB72_16680 [Pseudoalteromonas phenolica]|uniref:hypothetical protein n=1 Tax=Pseudoalteromonas phenolica TaxID=161398 RepID=UPI00110B4B60|nr:hypothetical protein [Pseudoalteromonas phenolica]TMN87089.1 hypothetical protein CWB72_16680 [Pseudoalteromonas phenolica]